MTWLKWKYQLVTAKAEETYGVNSRPSYDTDVLLVENLQIQPRQGSEMTRTIQIGAGSYTLTHLMAKHVVVTMDIPLTPSGALGTAPGYGHILQACGLSETIVAGVSVTYAPVDVEPASVSVRVRIGGAIQEISGCRGTCAIRASVPGIPYLAVTLTGLYTGPVSNALPTWRPGLSNPGQPLHVTPDNTAVTLSGVTLPATSIEVALGQSVQYAETTVAREVRLVDRAPTATIVAEADIDALNPFLAADAERDAPLVITHGSGASRIRISSEVARIGAPSWTEVQGAAGITIPLQMRSSSTEPDLKIIYG